MLRITADVNGTPIGYVFIHNTGRQRKGNVWEYCAATWNIEAQDGTFGIEGILHQRSRPWTMLLSQIVMTEGVK